MEEHECTGFDRCIISPKDNIYALICDRICSDKMPEDLFNVPDIAMFLLKKYETHSFEDKHITNILKWCNYDSNISSLRKRKVYQEVINYYNNKNNTRFNLTNKIDWPADHILFDMVKSHNINYVANKLGISFNAVKGRLKRRNFFN
jgi:hypothetical protein